MTTNRVVFSFFRYPLSHTFNAFVLMGFQGLARDRGLPRDKLRLMGCGGGDGFSILPDLRAYCLMSSVPGEGDWEQVQRTRLYRYVADPAIEQLHFHLRPMRGHGTWDGDPLFDYTRASPDGDPFVVLTHARVAPRHTRTFWSHVPAIRRHLAEAPGCVYHMGFGEAPLRTLATFSVWEDLEPMRRFAYRHSPHHDATRTARAEDWLTESMFARFHIDRIEGDPARYPRLVRLMRQRLREEKKANPGRDEAPAARGQAAAPMRPRPKKGMETNKKAAVTTANMGSSLARTASGSPHCSRKCTRSAPP